MTPEEWVNDYIRQGHNRIPPAFYPLSQQEIALKEAREAYWAEMEAALAPKIETLIAQYQRKRPIPAWKIV